MFPLHIQNISIFTHQKLRKAIGLLYILSFKHNSFGKKLKTQKYRNAYYVQLKIAKTILYLIYSIFSDKMLNIKLNPF